MKHICKVFLFVIGSYSLYSDIETISISDYDHDTPNESPTKYFLTSSSYEHAEDPLKSDIPSVPTVDTAKNNTVYEFESSSNEVRENKYWYCRIETRSTFGKFIGFNKNYWELGAFISPKRIYNVQPFIDLRGYQIEDKGDLAASLGIGARFLEPYTGRILGANLYYDHLKEHSSNFQRIGVGLETLGPCFDFRVNGYFPTSFTKHSKIHIFNNLGDGFMATCRQKKFAFKGFDAELGAPLCRWCEFTLYAAAGPYCYSHKNDRRFFGGFARIELNWLHYLTFEVRLSYDKEYHTGIQGIVLASFPLYEIFCCRAPSFCEDLFTQPVKRNNVMFIKHCCSWTWNW